MSHVSTPAGTVYDGPPVSTYSGAATVVATPRVTGGGETVFDETRFVPKRVDASLAVAATTKQVKFASMRFFLVAALALVELLVLNANGAHSSLLFGQGFIVVLFGTLGMFGYRLNKGAFLAGMLIYSAQTLMLVYLGLQTSMLFVGYAIFVRCTIIYRLYLAYGMICDLESL